MSRKLFLHVGMPKTASTALQTWVASNSETLLSRGIFYPKSDVISSMPKHQDLVHSLFNGDFTGLNRYVSSCPTSMLFLSTEGLTNHLYDFPQKHLETFREKLAGWHVTVFMVRRSLDSWLTSFWKQALLNPRNERFDYATPLPRDAFAQRPRIRRLCDTQRLAQDVRVAYGADEMIIADQGQDWFAMLREALKLPDTFDKPPRLHVSVSDDLAEIVRQINALPVTAEARVSLLGLLQHSCPTQHDISLRYAAESPPAKLAKDFEALSQRLLDLKPSTPEQLRVVQTMTNKLQSFTEVPLVF